MGTVSQQQPAWNQASIMRFMVLISCVSLACVSSVPLDAGYGIPSAPLVVSAPVVHQPLISHPVAAPLPVQLLNASPVNIPSLPLAAPLPVAPAPFATIPAPIQFATAPIPVAQVPVPAAAPLAVAPSIAPSSQFHAQDEFGQFSFGYENINSRKTETKDAFGVTRGSYQYVDANGVLQTINYVADPVNGFRVAGTNIPVAPGAPNAALPVAPGVPVVEPLEAPVPVMETPEVAAARAEHLKAVEEAKAASEEAEPTTEAEL